MVPENFMSAIVRTAAKSENDFALSCLFRFGFLFEHDLSRKPVPTFRDHALSAQRGEHVLNIFVRAGNHEHHRVRPQLRQHLRQRLVARCGSAENERGGHHMPEIAGFADDGGRGGGDHRRGLQPPACNDHRAHPRYGRIERRGAVEDAGAIAATRDDARDFQRGRIY